MRKKYLIKAPSYQSHIHQQYTSFVNSSSIRMQGAIKAYRRDNVHKTRLQTEGTGDSFQIKDSSLTHSNHFRKYKKAESSDNLHKPKLQTTLSKSKENIKNIQQKSYKKLQQEYRFSQITQDKKVKINPFMVNRNSESKSKGKQAPRPTMEKHLYFSPTKIKKFKEFSETSMSHLLKGTKVQVKPSKKRQIKTCVTEENEELSFLDVQIEGMLGKGTFGKVYRARLRKTGELIALKKIEQDKRYRTRELQIIKILESPYVVKVLGVASKQQGRVEKIEIAMEAYPCSFYEMLKRGKLEAMELKIYAYQMLRGVCYIHSLGVCHRDLKPQNMLVRGGKLVLCDFGSAKILKQGESNISYICSRCYRAPELIFESTEYSTKIDMWSIGCVLIEALVSKPLFIADCSLNHILEVIKVLGTPTREEVLAMNPNYDITEYELPYIAPKSLSNLFPGTDPLLIDLIQKLLCYSPISRLSAVQALAHPYFDELRLEFVFKSFPPIEDLQHFFSFTESQLGSYRNKLVPKWYKEQQWSKQQ